MGMTRGVFLKGLGFSYYLPDFLALSFYAAAAFGAAMIAFRKKAG